MGGVGLGWKGCAMTGRQTKYVVLEQRGRGEEREEGKREEELRA